MSSNKTAGNESVSPNKTGASQNKTGGNDSSS